MTPVAFLFAGQGAQRVGMGKDLAQLPVCARLFELADAALGYSLTQIMFEGPEEELTLTKHCQPALYIHGLACMAAFQKEAALAPTHTAGLSLGEFTAHAVAGTFSIDDGLRIVAKRGAAMQEACDASRGGMAALLGADEAQATQLAQQADVDVANFNCPGQVVLSGAAEHIERLPELAKAAAYLEGEFRKLGLKPPGRWRQTLTVTVNAKPTVNITSPTAGAVFLAGVDITITASASDADGSIAVVSFYAGTTQLGGAVSASPYAYTWTGVASGSYALTARATDNRGSVSTSAVVNIQVTQPPTVVLTTPTAGAKFGAGSDITLSAQASDPDGSIAAVRFYNGTTLLGSAGASPYTFAWMGVAPGSYVIRAEAQDDLGMTAITTGTPIGVNQAPVVSITSPQDGATYTASPVVSIMIAATATDPEGQMQKVEFYANGTLIVSDPTPPYSHTWMNVGPGSYQLRAVAYDVQGLASTSSAVNVTVVQSTALYTIEGYVTSAAGQGITGVTVTLTGVSSATVVTGADGRYAFTNLAGGNYTVRPAKEGWRFVPEVLSYTPLNRTWQNQNFVGEPAIAGNRLQITGGVDGYINPEYGEKVVVWINPKTGGNLDVLVYDLRGRLVMEKTKDGQAGIDDDIAWNAADLPAGVYVAKVSGGGTDTHIRVAVVK